MYFTFFRQALFTGQVDENLICQALIPYSLEVMARTRFTIWN